MYQELAKQYRTFDNVEHLNYAVRKHLYHNKHQLNKTAIDVFKLLARHAVKYVGVAYLKIETIAKAIDKHRSTVMRALKVLAELNIIEKLTQYRPKTGGNGANIYVIQRYKPMQGEVKNSAENANATPSVQLRNEAENTVVASVDSPKTECETEIPKSINKVLKRIRINSAFNTFSNWVKAYISDKKLTNKLYGIYKAQTHYIKGAYDAELLLHVGIQAIKTTFTATKRKNIKSLTGYFNGVLSTMLDKLYYSETAGYVTEDMEF
ncbi:helix-turn-helix domain-containing protein [Priestia megaterium]|uniref:helix-turn-helix domain-containing protein n=1 Tax=Priestia megaterium TaxID=1404 RepID=UPI000BFD28AD|nr:helix-turn-helix domain-containing protein [Priestia megaterium]PGR08528.1 helix-turn-helix domain-containing protein [Priestia megaterium]